MADDTPETEDAKAQLKAFARRLDTLLDEREGIAEDIKALKKEVEDAGFDSKALRKAVDTDRKIRRLAQLQTDQNYELYKGALEITAPTEPGDEE